MYNGSFDNNMCSDLQYHRLTNLVIIVSSSIRNKKTQMPQIYQQQIKMHTLATNTHNFDAESEFDTENRISQQSPLLSEASCAAKSARIAGCVEIFILSHSNN